MDWIAHAGTRKIHHEMGGVLHFRRESDVGEIDVDALLAEHGESILRVARRFSESAADAEDAFQLALEKLLTRAPSGRRDLPAWLSTVVRNEALMIRRSRRKFAPARFEDSAAELSGDSRDPEEAILAGEVLGRQREALKRLRPDQLRCMLLRADGMSQTEIVNATGFSISKVQRDLWEGRRAFTSQVARGESGSECVRIGPMLSTYVDDAISSAGRRDVELHLEGCIACRAVLRDYRAAPSDLAALFPVGALLAGRDRWLRWPSSAWDHAQTWLSERLFGASNATHGAELVFAKKVTLVTAVAASIVAGGAGVERVAQFADGSREAQFGRAARSVELSVAEDSPLTPPSPESTKGFGEADLVTPSAVATADLIEASGAVGESTGGTQDSNDESPPSGLPGDPVAGGTNNASGGLGDVQDAPSDAELLGAGE